MLEGRDHEIVELVVPPISGLHRVSVVSQFEFCARLR